MISWTDSGLTPEEFHQRMGQLRQQLVAGEPEELRRSYLAQPGFRELFTGTTVPALGTWRFVRLPSGLEVPEQVARRPQPLDQMTQYLTATEVLGFDPGGAWIVSVLDKLSLATVLAFTSVLLGTLGGVSVNWEQADRAYAERTFLGNALVRVRNLLGAGRHLLVPQVLLVLAKVAILRCPDTGPDDGAAGLLPAVLLALAEHLGSDRDVEPAELAASLEREVVANQHFNAPRDPAPMTARFTRRWLQIPTERADYGGMLDLEQLYEEATGVALRDVVVIGLMLWSVALQGTVRFSASYFDTLDWDPARVSGVLSLLSADRDTIRADVVEEDQQLGGKSLAWAFSPLERYPLLAVPNSEYLIFSPRLLLDRVCGWLPFFDVRQGLRDAGRNKDASRFDSYFRTVTELYAREVLESIAPSSSVGSRRVYHEDVLKATYGKTGIKIADAAIDYGTGWVIVEISTRQLTRASVAATSDLAADVDALVAKAEQVHSTIAQIRSNEEKLTGSGPTLRRQFFPVIVTTEGFPINPVVRRKLREALEAKGFLQDQDTGQLEILDIADLEIVEAIQEAGGPSLQSLLESKQTAGLSESSFRNYVLVERQLQPGRSQRLDAVWTTPFKITMEALGQDFPLFPSEM